MWPQAVHSREAAAGGAAGQQLLLNPLVDTREAQRRAQIQGRAQPAPATPPQARFVSGVDSQVSNTDLMPRFSLS